MFSRLVRSVGQRKNSESSWALRIFFPDIFLYFFTKLKTFSLSYSIYKDNLVSLASRTLLWAKKCCVLSRSTFPFCLPIPKPSAHSLTCILKFVTLGSHPLQQLWFSLVWLADRAIGRSVRQPFVSHFQVFLLSLLLSWLLFSVNWSLSILSADLGVWYLFKVSIQSTAGWSPETPIWVQMPPGPPTGPPLQVRSQAVSSTEIRVTWLEPDKWQRNGPLIGYTVVYNPLKRKRRVGVKNITNPNQTQALLTGLRMFTEYEIRVRALGLKGPGPLSRPVVEKTNEGGRSCF